MRIIHCWNRAPARDFSQQSGLDSEIVIGLTTGRFVTSPDASGAAKVRRFATAPICNASLSGDLNVQRSEAGKHNNANNEQPDHSEIHRVR